jgi:hypothetical protein
MQVIGNSYLPINSRLVSMARYIKIQHALSNFLRVVDVCLDSNGPTPPLIDSSIIDHLPNPLLHPLSLQNLAKGYQ